MKLIKKKKRGCAGDISTWGRFKSHPRITLLKNGFFQAMFLNAFEDCIPIKFYNQLTRSALQIKSSYLIRSLAPEEYANKKQAVHYEPVNVITS
jgi:hypothetical protein